MSSANITVTLPEPLTVGLGIEYFGMVPVKEEIRIDAVWIIAYPTEPGKNHLGRIAIDPKDPNFASLVLAMWQGREDGRTTIFATLPDPRLHASTRGCPPGGIEVDPHVIIHEISFTAQVCSHALNRTGKPGPDRGKLVRMNLRPSTDANWRAVVRGLCDVIVPPHHVRDQGGEFYEAP